MHGQWWSKFSRSFKGFQIHILNLQCRLIFLNFYPHLAYQCYHISASTSKIQAPVVWYHPWVLENALKSHVNIFLIYPQKWWSIGSRSLGARATSIVRCETAIFSTQANQLKMFQASGEMSFSMKFWARWTKKLPTNIKSGSRKLWDVSAVHLQGLDTPQRGGLVDWHGLGCTSSWPKSVEGYDQGWVGTAIEPSQHRFVSVVNCQYIH